MKNNIEAMRRRNGWTQQQLAEKLCVSRQTVISLECGRYNPSLLLAHTIAVTFGTTIESVFDFKEESVCPSTND